MKIVNVGFHLLNLISHFARRLFVYGSSLICFNEDVFERHPDGQTDLREREGETHLWVVVHFRFAPEHRKATRHR